MRKMLIYGAGELGRKAAAILNEKYDIVAFIDSEQDKWGSQLGDLAVHSPSMLSRLEYDFIEICATASAEIIKHSLIHDHSIDATKVSTAFVNQSVAARENTLLLASEIIYENNIKGNVAELGVYLGQFAKKINQHFNDRILYLFDTFTGLPEQDLVLEKEKGFHAYKASYLKDTALDYVIGEMPYPDLCVIRKGYFPDTAMGLEDTFAFVSIDPDLYKPVLEGLRYFDPRLQKNGIIMIHDYFNSYWCGVREAVRDYEIETESCLSKIPIGDLLSIAITK